MYRLLSFLLALPKPLVLPKLSSVRILGEGGLAKEDWRSRILLFCFLSLFLCFPVTVFAQTPPHPQSQIITGVTIDWSTHTERAPGSDNWPITWANDGHQYTSWGDGGGFGGTNSNGRTSLGIARIEGTFDNYQGCNVRSGVTTPSCSATTSLSFDGKSYGIISINGVLYMWWGPGSNTTSYNETRLLKSSDYGRNWTTSTWNLVTDVDDQLIMPTILNFGQDYQGARDQYVYHYFIRKESTTSGLGIHDGGTDGAGNIDLARTPVSAMPQLSLNDFEFFAGLNNNQPVWTTNASQRQAVFSDPNGIGWNASAIYNAGLNRYILASEHSASFAGNLGLFDAPEPWGPWTTIGYYSNWGSLGSNFFWNFSNKWTSSDGLNFSLIFTGTGDNDSWNMVRGTFTNSSPSPSPTPLPGDLDGDRDVDVLDWFKLMGGFNQLNCSLSLLGTCLVDIFDFNRIFSQW